MPFMPQQIIDVQTFKDINFYMAFSQQPPCNISAQKPKDVYFF
jgi:hypothetical protein